MHVSVESGSHPRFGVALPAVLVHGVVSRRFVVDLVGTGRVTAAKFRPGGFAAFTGVLPARDSVAPVDAELGLRTALGASRRGASEERTGARSQANGDGLAAAALLAAVLAEEDDDARAAALDAALAPRAPEPPAAYLDLLVLLDRMAGDRDLLRVDQVAALGGLSVRSLQRLFACYVGIGPKAVLARYRLQDAAAAIDAGEVDDLAGLAAALGWSDQAHFSREFRAVVGTTPSAYLRGRTVGGRASTVPGQRHRRG